MEPAETISRLGFRRWYERQLIQSHLWLLSCFLAMIMVFACLEVVNWRGGNLQAALYAILIAAGTLTGFFCWERYKRNMLNAERYGDHSICGACGAYGRFNIMACGARTTDEGVWLQVRCRKCGGEWRMP